MFKAIVVNEMRLLETKGEVHPKFQAGEMFNPHFVMPGPSDKQAREPGTAYTVCWPRPSWHQIECSTLCFSVASTQADLHLSITITLN